MSAHSRILLLAAFDGRLVRTAPVGTWISSQYQWAPIEEWHLTDLDALSTDDGSAELVDRYLRRFGPATETDLAWWTGWTKTQVRQAVATCGAVAVELEDGRPALVAADDDDMLEAEPWVAVLPGLDATTMGWKERDFYLDPADVPRLFDRFGNAGPTIWMDGRVVGGWAQREDGTLSIEMTQEVSAKRLAAIGEELDRVREFVGDTRYRIRFPSPNQKDLRA